MGALGGSHPPGAGEGEGHTLDLHPLSLLMLSTLVSSSAALKEMDCKPALFLLGPASAKLAGTRPAHSVSDLFQDIDLALDCACSWNGFPPPAQVLREQVVLLSSRRLAEVALLGTGLGNGCHRFVQTAGLGVPENTA